MKTLTTCALVLTRDISATDAARFVNAFRAAKGRR